MIKWIPNIQMLLSILLFLTFGSYAQVDLKIDSLKSRNLVETNKERVVYNLNSIADQYSLSNIDSALFYVNKALNLSKQIQYKAGEAEAYFLLGYYYDQAGDAKKAIDQLNKASQLFIEVGDSSYLTACYNNLGVIYSYGTDQPKSLEYFIRAKNLAEELEESYALSEAYANIGSYYEHLKQYNQALQYYTKGLELDIQNKYVEDITFAHLMVGSMNLKLHRTEEAISHMKKAQRLLSEIKDKYRKTELYINLADYYLTTEKTDSAKIYLNLAKSIDLMGEYPRLDADILVTEGDYFVKQGQNNEAIPFYDKAFDIYNKLEDEYILYDLYTKKAQAYANLGWHNKAYEMLRIANQIEESFQPHEISKILGEFEREVAAKEQKEQDLLEEKLLDQQKENKLIQYRVNLQMAVFSIIILSIVLGIAIYLYISKRTHGKQLTRREKELIKLNATKDKFFSIIAHDLKSPFNVLIGLSDIMLRDPDIKNSEEFEELVDGMNQTATTGYNLLENLLEWAMAQTGTLEHKPTDFSIIDLVTLNSDLFDKPAKTKSLVIKTMNATDTRVFADYEMINFVVRNLINNAIKYSMPDNDIEISTKLEKENCIVCVQDYGIGMDKDTVKKLFKIENNVQRAGTANEQGTGLGLILCKEFVEKNGGTIWVDSVKDKGSRFCFSIPASNK